MFKIKGEKLSDIISNILKTVLEDYYGYGENIKIDSCFESLSEDSKYNYIEDVIQLHLYIETQNKSLIEDMSYYTIYNSKPENMIRSTLSLLKSEYNIELNLYERGLIIETEKYYNDALIKINIVV